MLGININQNRIFGLDLLRALAIVLVVHGHGAHLLQGTALSGVLNLPMPDTVDIFFVLTGFLIGSAFLSYAEKHQRVDWRKNLHFYARSALRILPNYYFILLIYYLLVHGQIIAGDTHACSIWYFITFTQNLFTPFYNFYWESWTLPVQWWFYLLFPFLLALLTPRIKAKYAVPVICCLFILLSLVYRNCVASHATDQFLWGVWIRKTVASRCDSIYLGVLAACLYTYCPNFWKRHSGKCLIAGLLLLAFILIFPRTFGSFYVNVILLTLSPLAFALCLPSLSGIRNSKTFLGGILSHISILSYAMYLVNLMIIQIITTNFAETFSQWGAWGYLVYWVCVLVASYLLYMLVEKPFTSLRNRL